MSRFNYGGQAVIEGVMMRGKHNLAIAVRKTNQEISLKEDPLQSVAQRHPILKKPVIRGAVALIETLVMGMKCLTYSANEYAGDEQEELSFKELVLTIGAAVLLTVGLFILLPAYILRFIQPLIESNTLLNLIEGGIKITFFVLYILAISRMKDIQRVFQYHGAEHKAINCFESEQELTVENATKCSAIHTRCGTNFIMIVLFTSVVIFSLFGRPPLLLRVGIHLAIMPVVAGLSYELIRKLGQPQCPRILKVLALPGMALQYLTTRKPEDAQIEVAIAALESVIQRDNLLTEKSSGV